MIKYQPMRKVTTPIIQKDKLHPYEKIKNICTQKSKVPKLALAAAGSPPPPGGSGDSGDGDYSKFFKKPFTTEEFVKIHKICKGNLFAKDRFANMFYKQNIFN